MIDFQVPGRLGSKIGGGIIGGFNVAITTHRLFVMKSVLEIDILRVHLQNERKTSISENGNYRNWVVLASESQAKFIPLLCI